MIHSASCTTQNKTLNKYINFNAVPQSLFPTMFTNVQLLRREVKHMTTKRNLRLKDTGLYLSPRTEI